MADGWWNNNGAIAGCVAAYQPIGAADYATSKVNLFSPGTYDAADGAAYPTWDAINGWKFAGASFQLLTIPYTLPADSHTHSVILRLSNISAQNKRVIDAGGSNKFHIYPRYDGDTAYIRGYSASGKSKSSTRAAPACR